MANFYESYQFPYDYNQVNNLYDHNYYQYQQQQEIAFDPVSYNYYNNNNWNGSEFETTSASIAYSVSTISEPNHLFYDPNFYTTYESSPEFRIYCSVQGFNEPEFEEYDPTPYSGGFDISATYGKPLPPSKKTCYPSSTADQINPPSPPEIITPVPLGIYDGGENKVVKKRVTFAEPLEEAKPEEPIKEDKEEEDDAHEEEEEDEEQEEEEEEEDQDHSSSNGAIESEKVVAKEEVKALYVPSGYGLEATDLCEAIFGGYFPCVLRNKRRQEDEKNSVAYVNNDSDTWKTTSDYLFGDLYPYGYENLRERSQFEISSYGYNRSY